MGRPFKLTDHQKGEAIKRRDQGETLADIARSYNVSPATISGSQPRFCVRQRQATALPIKSRSAPGRPRPRQSKPRPARV